MPWHQETRSVSRRTFCRTFVGVLAASRDAFAQAPMAIRRIGFLDPGRPSTPEASRRETEPLRWLGWMEGRNLLIERRFADGHLERGQALAEERVRANVEIIVVVGTPATLAAKRATTTLPIVIRSSGDPVLLGPVARLARAGGNVTGYSLVGSENFAKQLSLLKEVLPRLERLGMVWEAGNPYAPATRSPFEQRCRSVNLVPFFAGTGAVGRIDAAFVQLVRQRAQAVVPYSSAFMIDHGAEIVGAATKRGLPTIALEPEGGALIAYRAAEAEIDRVCAAYIDRILRGAKPADLPVQQPRQFELIINLKTAKAVGITVPPSMLARADRLIR